MKFYCAYFVSVLCTVYIHTSKAHFVEVQIPQGKLKGVVKKSWLGREFDSFTGIPYAKPPTGNLRFEPPEPLTSWEGLLDATEYKSDCIQNNVYFNSYDITGNEDCLYINVFTPKLLPERADTLPVMFYTHGGGLSFGSGSDEWYGPDFFMDEDVVLVTYNYRLGPLGFLSTGDEIVPGNNGLKDQSLALIWTKNNIKHFGGNPNKITVFGNSAGGANTHYFLFSPLTKNLFRGAIIQSGTAFASWALASKQYANNSKIDLAKSLGCPTSSSKELVNCLRKKNASEIIFNASKIYKWSRYDPTIPFRPVIEPNVDGAFLVEKPETTAELGKAANVPIVLSFTTDDGFLRSGHIFNNSLDIEFNNKFDEIAPYSILYFENQNQQDINNKIRSFYFKNKTIDKTTITELTNVITDSWFLYPLIKSAVTHKKYVQKPVYTFLYGYRGQRSYGDFYGDRTFSKVVCHSDELLYIFTTRAFGIYHNTDIEKKVVRSLVKLWTNFAKYGDPTPTKNEDLAKWEPVKDENFSFYYVNNSAHFQMIENPFLEQFQFWKEIRDPITKSMF